MCAQSHLLDGFLIKSAISLTEVTFFLSTAGGRRSGEDVFMTRLAQD